MRQYAVTAKPRLLKNGGIRDETSLAKFGLEKDGDRFRVTAVMRYR